VIGGGPVLPDGVTNGCERVFLERRLRCVAIELAHDHIAIGVNINAQLDGLGLGCRSLHGGRLTNSDFIRLRFPRWSTVARFRALRPPHVIFSGHWRSAANAVRSTP
jgi:hypothetical protein